MSLVNSVRLTTRVCAQFRGFFESSRACTFSSAATEPVSSSVDAQLATVALIGRPNVGKSTLFNRLTQRSTALVWNTPGSHVTRDYKEGVAALSDLRFKVVDTSGLEPFMSKTSIQGRATDITKRILREADAALLLIDGRAGVCAQDLDMARWIRRHVAAPVIVVAAKCDNPGDVNLVAAAHEASALGLGDAVAYSAQTRAGTADLYDALRPILEAHARDRDVHGSADADADGSNTDARFLSSAGAAAAPAPAKTARTSSNKRARAPAFGGWTGPSSVATSTAAADAGNGSDAAHEAPAASDDAARLTATELADGLLAESAGALQSPAEDSTEGQLACAGEPRDGAAGDDAALQSGSPRSATTTQPQQPVLGRDAPIKLVILGLPNTGKSTLLNRLLGYERALTGAEAGLTRDAVSVPWTWRGTRFELTDTAGWMRHRVLNVFDDVGGKVAALTVSQGSAKLSFAHAALLLFDAAEASARLEAGGPDRGTMLNRRELDLALAVLREGRLLLLGANKCDALDATQRTAVLAALEAQVGRNLASYKDCVSALPVSGATGRGLNAVLERICELTEKWSSSIKTADLNNWRYKMALAMTGHGSHPITQVKYLKMISTRPPTLLAEFRGKVVARETPEAVARLVRRAFGLEGVPVRVVPMTRVRREAQRARLAQLARKATRDGGAAPKGLGDILKQRPRRRLPAMAA